MQHLGAVQQIASKGSKRELAAGAHTAVGNRHSRPKSAVNNCKSLCLIADIRCTCDVLSSQKSAMRTKSPISQLQIVLRTTRNTRGSERLTTKFAPHRIQFRFSVSARFTRIQMQPIADLFLREYDCAHSALDCYADNKPYGQYRFLNNKVSSAVWSIKLLGRCEIAFGRFPDYPDRTFPVFHPAKMRRFLRTHPHIPRTLLPRRDQSEFLRHF